jgi:hypothetical protein
MAALFFGVPLRDKGPCLKALPLLFLGASPAAAAVVHCLMMKGATAKAVHTATKTNVLAMK